MPEQSNRLSWGKPPYSFRAMSAIPQLRQAISTALYLDIVFLRPPYCGIHTTLQHFSWPKNKIRQLAALLSTETTIQHIRSHYQQHSTITFLTYLSHAWDCSSGG